MGFCEPEARARTEYSWGVVDGTRRLGSRKEAVPGDVCLSGLGDDTAVVELAVDSSTFNTPLFISSSRLFRTDNLRSSTGRTEKFPDTCLCRTMSMSM